MSVSTTVRSVNGTDSSDVLFGGGRNDKIEGYAGDDRLHGGGGNDVMGGGAGNDVMFGDSGRGGAADMTKLRIAQDAKGSVTFNNESAGYQNAVGMYKIAADGSIKDVSILWANASLKGSGGDLKQDASSVDFGLAAGERVGFFVVPNGYAQSGMSKVLADQTGSFKFVDAKGHDGNVNGGTQLQLVHVAANGKETVVKSEYGTSVFHSVDDGSKGLNGDGLNHTHAVVDTEAGTIRIGFEDIKGGGDKDFDDSVFTLNLGQTNAALVAKVATSSVVSEKNDVMTGGDGNDTMFGMSGHDHVSGNDGNDVIYGNSGNDVLSGGAGNDELHGGSGDDTIYDGDGNDYVEGNSGNDLVVAGEGNDSYLGGSGYDTIDFSGAKQGMTIDLSKKSADGMGHDFVSGFETVIGSSFDDVMQGSKSAETLVGGDGNDVLRGLGGADTLTGGKGNDTFTWQLKDVFDGKTHLGVDHVTDFEVGDTLDLHAILKGHADGLIVKDGDAGTTVSVDLGGGILDVAVLDGVHGLSGAEMLKAGMILA